MFVVKLYFLVVMFEGPNNIKLPRVIGRYAEETSCQANMPKDKASNCILSTYHVHRWEITEGVYLTGDGVSK